MEDTAALDLETVRSDLTKSIVRAFTNGTGNAKAQVKWSDRRIIAASGNEDLDLAAGLTDSFGRTITFTKIKALIIEAASGNTNNVVVTRPGSNGVPIYAAAGDAHAIQPNGVLIMCDPNAGVTVTPGTGDLINISNSAGGTGVTYDIIIIGEGSVA